MSEENKLIRKKSKKKDSLIINFESLTNIKIDNGINNKPDLPVTIIDINIIRKNTIV